MRLYLVCDGESPNLLIQNIGPHWLRVANGTALEAAKFIIREAGGSQDRKEVWKSS